MQKLIQDYEVFVQEMQQRINEGESYMDRLSDGKEVYEEIDEEQRQTNVMIERYKELAELSQQVRMYKQDPIPDHFDFRVTKLKEVDVQDHPQHDPFLTTFPEVNHTLQLALRIEEITPILGFGETVPTSLRFRLHYANQTTTSEPQLYSSQHGLHRRCDIVDGFMIKHQRSVSLSTEYTVRTENVRLYRQILQLPIKIVAEGANGLVLGIASIEMRDLMQDVPFREKSLQVSFKKQEETVQYKQMTSRTSINARISLSIDYQLIAPPIKELQEFDKQRQQNRRKNSKSPSRIIVRASPKRREQSPKQRRLMTADLIQHPDKITRLTLLSGRQFRMLLDSFDPAEAKELTYHKLAGVKERKVEVSKTEGKYYMKVWAQAVEDKGTMVFAFGGTQYSCEVIENRMFEFVPFNDYAKAVRDKKETKYVEKLVDIGEGMFFYTDPSTRFIRNPVKQTTTDGLLSSIFIKTPFEGSQLQTRPPFRLHSHISSKDGYMVHYFYLPESPLEEQIEVTLPFFIRSEHRHMREVHAFQCSVVPRRPALDTPMMEVPFERGEQFVRIGMAGVTAQQQVYQIHSSDREISVVNGENFRIDRVTNPYLVLQMLRVIEWEKSFDLLFADGKQRCFFVRVRLVSQPPSDQ